MVYEKNILSYFVRQFVVPLVSRSAMTSPYFNVSIIENAVGNDGIFNFGIYGYSPVTGTYLNQNVNIQTSGGVGSYTNNGRTGNGDNYTIMENIPDGWQLSSVSCTSNNSSVQFSYVNNMVYIVAYPYSNVTCNFTNTQLSQSKTPVLIVPGVLGTDIYNGTDLLWANPKMTLGFDSFMDPLAFNSSLEPINNSLSIGSVIREKTFLGIGSDYADGLITQLTASGYTEGKDLFTFPYDWRYGVSEDVVNQFKGQIDYILNQTDAGKAAGKVDVVAHSTGGLIVKKYIMEHQSSHGLGKVVFVGVPNLGTPQALKVLLDGDSFGVLGLDPQEMKKIGQNMPVIYDLMADRQYVDQAGSYFGVAVLDVYSPSYKDLNYSETENYLSGAGFNAIAMNNSAALHSSDFDSFDMRTAGVDFYNIVGCKSNTLGQILDEKDINGTHLEFEPNPHKNFSGDGTVTFASADSLAVDANKTFFVPKIQHSNLLSADGPRQEIVNLLTGSNLDTGGKVLTHDNVQQNPSLCQIKGDSINIKSPVAISATDQYGNYSGLAPDGSIQNDIPGADYEIWGEHKYVFLPTDAGQAYSIQLKGTNGGTFTLDDQNIVGNNIIGTQVFSNLPVTTALSGTVNLGTTDTLSLDTNGDGTTDQTVQPSSLLNADQSQDMVPPVSTSTIAGVMGQTGFYRSNATVTLSAIDPVISGQESQTSGILNIRYSLDNNATTTYQGPISVSAEGPHSIKYFSTDKAGNNEQPQTINFTIDKTAPEVQVQFNPNLKDIQFSGSDNISTSSKISVVDNVNDIVLSDQAGNITEVKLKEKNRKVSMQSTIQSLSYNGTSQDMSKNILAFVWQYDKNNNLSFLSQNVAAKKTYVILATYDGKKTTLVGLDTNRDYFKIHPRVGFA